MPITPKTGSLFHAETQHEMLESGAVLGLGSKINMNPPNCSGDNWLYGPQARPMDQLREHPNGANG